MSVEITLNPHTDNGDALRRLDESSPLAIQTYEAIIDSGASEWFKIASESIESIQQYADGAFDRYLTEEEAAIVFEALSLWARD